MSVLAVARKEVRQLSRDPRTIAVLLVLPALLLLFYGYVLSFDVAHVSLAVLDHDRTEASRRLARRMTSGEWFDRVATLEADAQVIPTLEAGRATLVLVIPEGYGEALAAGRQAVVQALIDGSNSTSAQTAQGYAEGFVAAEGASLAEGFEPPIQTRPLVLYNPELASDRFLLPGLVAFILMISATVVTALSVVKERETGTMEQLLVSPLRPIDVIAGKALPYGALALAAAVFVLATARVAFGLKVQGDLLLLLAVTVIFVLGGQGLGLFISSITRSQQVAFQVATFATMLPTMLLSGFIFPIRSMPLPVQFLTYAVPARYFVAALRGIILKGVGIQVVWPQMVALAIFATLTLGVATRRIRGGGL
jgi:ABC-2 type transport system permease protein